MPLMLDQIHTVFILLAMEKIKENGSIFSIALKIISTRHAS